MPTIAEILLRDHVRYSGDGKPDQPMGMPAPTGDPESGIHHPSKADFRNAIGSVTDAADRADDAADLIDLALGVNARPLVVLFIGQSNMRGNSGALGGEMGVPTNTYVWNNYIPPVPGSAPVAGTAFTDFVLGQYPADQQVGAQYVTTLPHSILRELSVRTKRPIYAVTIACGGQSIEAFLRPATRTANSWPLTSGDIDLSAQMYPQLANALAAVPGSPSFFDAVFMHQGEKNMNLGDTAPVYRAKIAALASDLVGQGVANNVHTQFVLGTVAQASGRYVDHLATLTNNLPGAITGLKIYDSRGLIAEDGLHFNGNGINVMGERAAEAFLSPLNTTMTAFNSFTPQISGAASGGGVAGGTYSGIWRREGRTVTVHVTAIGITTGGLDGANFIFIRNFPFPVADYVTGSVNIAQATYTGTPTVTSEPGQSYARIVTSASGAALGVLTLGALSSGNASIRFSLTYTTNS